MLWSTAIRTTAHMSPNILHYPTCVTHCCLIKTFLVGLAISLKQALAICLLITDISLPFVLHPKSWSNRHWNIVMCNEINWSLKALVRESMNVCILYNGISRYITFLKFYLLFPWYLWRCSLSTGSHWRSWDPVDDQKSVWLPSKYCTHNHLISWKNLQLHLQFMTRFIGIHYY